MNKTFRCLSAIVATAILFSNSFVLAGGTMSRHSDVAIPPRFMEQIAEIREDYKKEILTEKTLLEVQSADKKQVSRRLTIMIIPCEEGSAVRDRSGSVVIDPNLHMNQKIANLMGPIPSSGEVPVAFGSWKGKIHNLINSEELSQEQKLEVIKMLCEPCDGYRFIDGDIEKITSIKSSKLRKVSASLIEMESGILIITCILKNGEQILCYI